MENSDLVTLLGRILPEESAPEVVDEFAKSEGWHEGRLWFFENDDGKSSGVEWVANRISDDAFDLIVFCEVTSHDVYDAKYRGPIWPGEQSGVTIGIGYDIGYVSKDRLWLDWNGVIPDKMIDALQAGLGIHGPAAKPIAKALKGQVDVPFAAAISVHASKVLPRWFTIVDSHLDNTDLLGPDCFGALVSLTYNRGPSFSKSGDRYAEMRAIRAHMNSRRFDRIPAELRSMKRLWPNSAGLRKRREAEATLFEKGLEANAIPAERAFGAPARVILRVQSETLNLRTVPSSAKGAATVVEVLPKAQLLTMMEVATTAVDWVRVTSMAGNVGFVKRMLTVQDNPGTLIDVPNAVMEAYNRSIYDDSRRFDAVTYLLGAKDPNSGTVDCSGWICFVNRRAFSAANRAAKVELFTSGMAGMLNTHSDHQVAMPGYREKQLFSTQNAQNLEKRPGLLIGLNFSDYGWEKGQSRVFEIDHIVQTFAAPDGEVWITQSSSSGGGVNTITFENWIKNAKVAGLVNANRLHVFDVFQMASMDAMRVKAIEDLEILEQDLEIPEQDTSETPAG